MVKFPINDSFWSNFEPVEISQNFNFNFLSTDYDSRKFLKAHRSFLSLFLFRHGLKSELEEISQKFNFLLKGTVSGKFLKAFLALFFT